MSSTTIQTMFGRGASVAGAVWIAGVGRVVLCSAAPDSADRGSAATLPDGASRPVAARTPVTVSATATHARQRPCRGRTPRASCDNSQGTPSAVRSWATAIRCLSGRNREPLLEPRLDVFETVLFPGAPRRSTLSSACSFPRGNSAGPRFSRLSTAAANKGANPEVCG